VDTVKRLLEDDPALLLRETMGVSVDSTNKAFKSNYIEEMMNVPPTDISKIKGARNNTTAMKWVILAVDPSGGGGSAFSIVAILYTVNNEFAVRLPNQTRKQHVKVLTHDKKIKRLTATRPNKLRRK
jgi:hypothetical protein